MSRRLTTIVAADLAGYSRLMAADEEGVIARLRACRADVIDPAIATGGGRVIKSMGDGLLIEFASPVEAVRAILTVQEIMATRETGPDDQRLKFRVGINLGDVVEDGDDILGDGVNVAARLESLAPPGGVCISRSVHDQLRGKTDAPLTPLGPQMVKNLPDPVEVWRLEVAGADAAPPLGQAAQDRPSIAVLPFANMSSDPDQDFLADGIVEDVITALSRFRSLFVIGRGSSFAYRDTALDLRSIASELSVRYLVQGSVRRAGDRLRVSAQLIEAESGAQIWADRWDRTPDDLFDLQDELTKAIVTGAEAELGAHERSLARHKPTSNMTAWEMCQKGMAAYFSNPADEDGVALGLLDAARKADPQFALSYAMLARRCYNRVAIGLSADPVAVIATGLSHARQSLALDDRLEAAHTSLGLVLMAAGRGEEAKRAIEKALALNANDPCIHHARSVIEMSVDEPDINLMTHSARLALAISPKDPLAYASLHLIAMATLLQKGEFTVDARDIWETAASYPNADYFAPLHAALENAATGRRDAARRYLAAAMERSPRLSRALWRQAVERYPAGKRLIPVYEPALDILVEQGLPEK